MKVTVHETRAAMGRQAAADGADRIRTALAARGSAAIILATGTSQYEMLQNLVRAEGIDWSKVDVFHLDEYIGLADSHPASFRRFLRERFLERIPCAPARFYTIDGSADPCSECRKLGELIGACTVDVAFVGIGENGHLAFNDPPADFDTREAFIVVKLDEACRRQQLGEGWFPSLDEVPRRAISMSISAIMDAERIICTVPDSRKAAVTAQAVEGPVTPDLPASILQTHADCRLHLDTRGASCLKGRGRNAPS